MKISSLTLDTIIWRNAFKSWLGPDKHIQFCEARPGHIYIEPNRMKNLLQVLVIATIITICLDFSDAGWIRIRLRRVFGRRRRRRGGGSPRVDYAAKIGWVKIIFSWFVTNDQPLKLEMSYIFCLWMLFHSCMFQSNPTIISSPPVIIVIITFSFCLNYPPCWHIMICRRVLFSDSGKRKANLDLVPF